MQVDLIESPELRKAVLDFAEEIKDTGSDPLRAGGKCYHLSVVFAKRVEDLGLDATVVAIGDHPHYARYLKDSSNRAWPSGHYVVKIGLLRIDFTARQFSRQFAYPHVWKDSKTRDGWLAQHDQRIYAVDRTSDSREPVSSGAE